MLAIYGIPWLEPRLVAEQLGVGTASHFEVTRAATERIRADVQHRRGTRTVHSVVLAHTFASGGISSDSERDLSIGGVGAVPLDLFDGFGYTALGHLHGRQELSAAVRYSGSPLAYSFSEAKHKKGSWLVEVDAAGIGEVREVLWEPPRTLAVLRGKLEDLLESEDFAWAEDAYCQITLTDPARPAQAMDRLRARFPDTLVLGFDPEGAGAAPKASYSSRLAEAEDDLSVCCGFLEHVRGRPAYDAEAAVLAEALEAVRLEGGVAVRIHRLEISAFGPFAGTERIDFDRLSAHGLFLLNGATGAGKTSVLDAICFALYGSVPGARQDGKRLRSDHAEAAAEPRVTCEFSAKGRHFEVSRSPAWNKPSARGKNGFTLQQANTLLRERIDGVWMEKSGRNDEAGAEIADVLGMNRDQFTRVVMLPQGDFAAFLRSKASDRLELLQSLFGTQRFEAVEQELARQAQAAKTEVASLTTRLDLLLSQAEAETAALELDPEGAPGRDAPDALLAWLDDAAATAAAGRRAAAAAAERQSSSRPRVWRPPTLGQAARRNWPPRNCAALTPTPPPPVLAEQALTLGLHRKAEVLGGQLRAVESAQAAEDLAGTALAEAARELRSAAVTDPELAGLVLFDPGRAENGHASFDSAALRSALGRLRSLRAVLAERLPDEARLAGLTDRRGRLRRQLQDLETGQRTGAAALDALRSESAVLLAGIQPLEELAAEVQLRNKEATAADELVTIVGRYLDAEAACCGHRGTARRGPDRTPGPSPALARPPRATAHQRRSRTRHPAPRRRSLPGLR